MATKTKKSAARKKKEVVDKTLKDYTNDPFFIKKRETALRLIKKTGIPNSFTRGK
jgi:hypothetical protein